MKFELYNLATGEGKHIRRATRVTLASGRVVEFMERLSNKEARRQAQRLTPQVSPQVKNKCPKCYGTGNSHSYPFNACLECHGTGRII